MIGRVFIPIVVFVMALTARASHEDVRIERTDGSILRCRLIAIDSEGVSVRAGDEKSSLPLAAVRRVVVDQATKAFDAPKVKLVLVDGGELSGTDVAQTDGAIVLTSTDGKATLPIEKVSRIAWFEPAGADPTWVPGLPPRPTSDLLVVRREEGHEFVECAVTGIDADTVSVVLDGETIPVKRAKVAGIVWLREAAKPEGAAVIVRGGSVRATSIEWSPETLILDETVRLPGASLRAIDYATGRTVPVAGIEPERVDVEPLFGNLRDVPGLATFFAPRTIMPPSGEGPAVLLVRPRTVLTWRIPADSRRFQARVERDVPLTATAQVDFVLAADDKEILRRRVDAASASAPMAIEVDVAGSRRLTLTVDFVPGDIGCGIRLTGASFEK